MDTLHVLSQVGLLKDTQATLFTYVISYLIVHDKLKSNLCHICGYVASTKITLKNHMESAH